MPLPLQYADFAAWQRQYLSGEVLAEQIVYWKEKLREAPAALELPTDRPRPAVQTQQGAKHVAMMPKELLEKLKRLSRQEGVTLFMTLLAGWQAVARALFGASGHCSGFRRSRGALASET